MRENPDKSRTARILSFILLLAALAAIALYIRAHGDSLRAVSRLSIRDGALLFVLGVFTIAVNGLFLKTFAAKYQVNLLAKEWFGLAAVTTMGNYLTPFSGGMIARAAYLKKRHSLSYSKFATLLAANYLLVYLVIALAGILLICLSPSSAGYSRALLLFFAGVAGLILVLLKVKRVHRNVTNRYVEALNHALQGWEEMMKDRILAVKILFLTAVNITAGALLFYIAFGALGFPVTFTTALLIYLITSFSLLINVTPGNFGVQEAVSSFAAAMLGAGAGLGLMAALMIRVATMAAAFTLGPLFGMLLAREMAENKTAGSTGGSR
jgi:uncharacterized protein (TIRG00374 family)